MEELHNNNFVVCSLNCEGLRRSIGYIICNFLHTHHCDILCLQKTWTIDTNLCIFSNVHTDYLFTCISGVYHTIDNNVINGGVNTICAYCIE